MARAAFPPSRTHPGMRFLREWYFWLGWRRIVAFALAAPFLAAAAWWLVRVPPPPVESMIPVVPTAPASAGSDAIGALAPTDPLAPLDTLAPQGVTVHVVGAVNDPGVYRLAPGARGDDALRAAGGARPDADLRLVNLAAVLVDGEQLSIPRVGERPPATVVAGDGTQGPRRPASSTTPRTTLPLILDINRATAADFDRLPGIGPKTAQAIVDHRARNGPFATVDDLLSVRGIGPATLAEIRNWVRV